MKPKSVLKDKNKIFRNKQRLNTDVITLKFVFKKK